MKTTLRIALPLLFCIMFCLFLTPAVFADNGDFTLPANTTVIEDGAFAGCIWMKSVTIPESVTEIGQEAFSGCSGLTEIAIPNSVKKLGEYCFYDCSSLTSAVISEEITKIGDCTFYNCSNLRSVIMPVGIEGIGKYAFSNCSKLSGIILPEGMKSVDIWAFFNCGDLSSVVIPVSVTSIGDRAFQYCEKLSDVYYGGTEEQWNAIVKGSFNETLDNAKIHFAKDSQDAFYSGTWGNLNWALNSDGLLTIEGEGSIEDFPLNDESHAWRAHLEEIVNVSITEGVTSIGMNAFLNCGKMGSITIPSSVTSIGDFAFTSCYSMNNITIPDHVTYIGNYAFSSCGSLTRVSIPEGVQTISRATFYWCPNLKSITIPSTVTYIYENAFADCDSLSDVYYNGTVNEWNAITKGDNNETLNNAEFHFNYVIPTQSTVTVNISEAEGGQVFLIYNNTSLAVQNGTVVNCNSGDVLGIQGVPNTGYSCQISATMLSDGTEIALSTLADGSRSFVVPASDVELRVEFSNSENTIIASGMWNAQWNPNLSWSLTESGILTIKGSGMMADFNDHDTNGWHRYSDKIQHVIIDEGVTSIGVWAFQLCDKLTSISIPSSVQSIDSEAFQYCSSLTSISITEGVRNIGDNVFSGCSSLTSVEISSSLSSIGRDVFVGCNSLTSIHVSSENQTYSDIHGILFSKNRTELLCCPAGLTGEYEIPEGVDSIGISAFSGCKLTSISIPSSVTIIKGKAFRGCKSLLYVNIPEGLLSIYDEAFSGCSSLKMIEIPSSVSYIGYEAFCDCSSMESLSLSEGVTIIREYAFSKCISLKNVTIPSSVSSINESTFMSCTSLTSITIPEGITSIGQGAFWNCGNLTKISIPKSMTSIGNYAFYYCDNLNVVYFSGTKTQWGAINIGSYNQKLTGAKNKYYNSDGTEANYSEVVSGILQSGDGWQIKWEVLYNIVSGVRKNAFLKIYIEGENRTENSLLLNSTLGDGVIMPWLTEPYNFQKTDFEKIYIVGSIANPLNVIPNQFSGYSNVQTIQLDFVEMLQSNAFSDCTSLETVIFDGWLDFIGNSAFKNDANLYKLYNRSKINKFETIGDEAFMNTGLTSFDFHSALKTIGNRAFLGSQLTSAEIGPDVISIGENAFDRIVVFYCYRDSEAQRYAEREGVKCVLLDSTHDDTENNFETTFTASSGNIGTATVSLKRGFDFVNTDSSQFNYELALTGVTLSAQVYKKAQGMKTEGILHELGYDTTGFSNSDSSFAHPGVCFGYKQINNGKNLFAVVVRGTDTTDDLIDVWTDLEDGALSMFRVSSEYVEAQLEDFMVSATGKTVVELQQEDNYFFITGHSLGGAIANCLSVNGNIMEFAGSDKGKIYTYTFESPHTCENLWWTDPESESNAFNYKVDGDAVTNLPPYAGSTTYGKDVWIRVSELDDDLFNELFPDSLCKTLAIATSVDGHGDSFGLHDVCLDLIYVVQHSIQYSGGGW